MFTVCSVHYPRLHTHSRRACARVAVAISPVLFTEERALTFFLLGKYLALQVDLIHTYSLTHTYTCVCVHMNMSARVYIQNVDKVYKKKYIDIIYTCAQIYR